ncbi:F-box domain-containing protein [Colletotrichum scovillei]|uniref:F-box domain-containing protein n=1 Tax=Colletotrichum scovillei TaxID=1209932 RepID=UPI0015C40218|nr:F-box domain-containing protein [Colletotrichum scovillei]KAF4776206.1 F-box domain-containing protein [Colletotrichum scovillei]
MEYARGSHDGVLAEQLAKLTNADGSPNTALRHANLDNLVSRLTPWELLYLRQLTSKSTIKLAEMHHLPEEVVAMIAQYLRLGDALKCTQVSKAWRAKWTSDTVAREIAQISFPGLVAASPDASAWDLLRPIAHKATARNEGKLTSWLSINTADVPLLKCTALKYDKRSLKFAKSKPTPTSSRFFKNTREVELRTHLGFAYCSGKVAWQWDSYRFFVDDIRAMTRKLVPLPDLVVKGDKDFIVHTMTENLLILVDQYSMRALIVYDLVKEQHRRVTLPRHMTDLQAHKDTFVVIFNSDYYHGEDEAVPTPPHVWTWSTGLVKLQVPISPAAHERHGTGFPWEEHVCRGVDVNNGFIFHPTNPHVLYFVSFEEIDTDSYQYVSLELLVEVHKFEDMKFVKTFPYKLTRKYKMQNVPRFATHCRPMNSYGLFNIGNIYRSTSKSLTTVKSELSGKEAVRTPSLPVRSINFNTVTESFIVEKRVLNGMRRPIWDFGSRDPSQTGGILWNDSIYYIQNKSPIYPGDNKSRWRHEFEGNGQRSICIANKSSTVVLETNNPWFTGSEAFRTIAVDDDFVVGLSSRSYVVYNFGDSSLKGGPWCEPHNVRLYMDNKDTKCPVWGCPGPNKSSTCQVCSDDIVDTVNMYESSDEAETYHHYYGDGTSDSDDDDAGFGQASSNLFPRGLRWM